MSNAFVPVPALLEQRPDLPCIEGAGADDDLIQRPLEGMVHRGLPVATAKGHPGNRGAGEGRVLLGEAFAVPPAAHDTVLPGQGVVLVVLLVAESVPLTYVGVDGKPLPTCREIGLGVVIVEVVRVIVVGPAYAEAEFAEFTDNEEYVYGDQSGDYYRGNIGIGYNF